MSVETLTGKLKVSMPKPRQVETSEQRNDRLVREAQLRKDKAAANEATVDRMISRNVEQFGP